MALTVAQEAAPLAAGRPVARRLSGELRLEQRFRWSRPRIALDGKLEAMKGSEGVDAAAAAAAAEALQRRWSGMHGAAASGNESERREAVLVSSRRREDTDGRSRTGKQQVSAVTREDGRESAEMRLAVLGCDVRSLLCFSHPHVPLLASPLLLRPLTRTPSFHFRICDPIPRKFKQNYFGCACKSREVGSRRPRGAGSRHILHCLSALCLLACCSPGLSLSFSLPRGSCRLLRVSLSPLSSPAAGTQFRCLIADFRKRWPANYNQCLTY